MSQFIKVALPLKDVPPLTYSVGENLDIKPGLLVDVPLKEGVSRGVVWEFVDEAAGEVEIKEVISVPDEELVIDEKLMELARWMVDYYYSSPGKVLSLFFPPGVFKRERREVKAKRITDEEKLPSPLLEILSYLSKRRRWLKISTLEKVFGSGVRNRLKRLESLGLIEIRERIPERRPRPVDHFIEEEVFIEVPSEPNSEQDRVLRKILPYIREEKYRVFLLHGVTGSGKTAVYMWLTEEVLKTGKSALVLVPEIGMAQEVLRVFYEKFGENVALYHSNFTASERLNIWKEVKRGIRRVVIGPRSALFLPLPNLGLVVVDEEHEASYKQMESEPYYHARDVAVYRAKIENVPVILGSATPSLESYYNARKGKYTLLHLKRRVKGYYPPRFEVVDMREESTTLSLSIKLIERLREVLLKGKQAIVFINRRGYAPFIQCASCGYIEKCPRCSVTLVYHKRERVLRCHLCDYVKPAPDRCPECGSFNLYIGGVGTERVEEELKELFKDENIARMDLDTTRRRGAHERIYAAFKRGEIKILVGTQMVGKGFDFPEVDLVGVVSADVTLNLPDFRAEERTFQLLTQVAGRVRRGGRVVIQTYSPESPAVKFTVQRKYVDFAENELKEREKYGYPPFRKLVVLEVRGKDEGRVIRFISEVADKVKGIEREGPAPAPIERVRGEYRWRILFKGDKPFAVQQAIKEADLKVPRGLKLIVDVDPVDLM